MTKNLDRPEDTHWQVSQPKVLLKTSVMDVLGSDLTCSRTGKQKQFYRCRYQNWVNIVALTADQEILLIKQYRFGTGRVELEIPGGAIDNNEPVVDAGLRELLEETGYTGEKARIIGQVCPNPALQDNTCYTILVENAKKVAEPNQDEMEDITTLTLPENQVFELVKQGTISHGLVLNGLMFYQLSEK